MGFYSEHVFPRICRFAMSSKSFHRARRDILREARGSVLEIGFGSGENLKFYPDTLEKLTALEPNRGMKPQSDRTARKRGGAYPLEWVLGSAHAMPFSDGTFDTVVSTFTLCSVGQPALALVEAQRVLKPGGRLLVLEHGLSHKPGVQKWQFRLNSLQSKLADGCQLVRDMETLVSSTKGLTIERARTYQLPGIPATHGTIYEIVARRAETPKGNL